jgi:hypothetical protein
MYGFTPLGPDVPRSDAFVIAGQSNATGSSTLPPFSSTYAGSPLDSWVYDLCFDWKPANDPIHCYSATVKASPWPTFASLWTVNLRRPVVFVATAVGGTCLVGAPWVPVVAHWNPDGNPATDEGLLYRTMLDMVHGSIQPGSRLRAVLWYQGECEVTYGVPYSIYKAALKRFADRVWQDLAVPVLVAPVSLRPPPWPLQPARVPIHDATIDAANEHPHILLGPNTDDLLHEADGAHIRDVATLGVRWYLTALAQIAPLDCADGRDGDADGLVDLADPGCASASDLTERNAASMCDDGSDNDGDRRVDFPADAQCASPLDSAERSGCGLGFELVGLAPLLWWRARRAAARARA